LDGKELRTELRLHDEKKRESNDGRMRPEKKAGTGWEKRTINRKGRQSGLR